MVGRHRILEVAVGVLFPSLLEVENRLGVFLPPPPPINSEDTFSEFHYGLIKSVEFSIPDFHSIAYCYHVCLRAIVDTSKGDGQAIAYLQSVIRAGSGHADLT
jgi:hypothetical protein